MKKEVCKKMTMKLLNEVNEVIEHKIDKAISCGAIDIDSYDDAGETNYRLAKIVLSAVLKDLAFQYSPLSKDDNLASDNLYKFI